MTNDPSTERTDAERLAAEHLDADGKAVRRPGDPPPSPAPPAAGAIDRDDPPRPNDPPPDKEGTGTPQLTPLPPSAGIPGGKR